MSNIQFVLWRDPSMEKEEMPLIVCCTMPITKSRLCFRVPSRLSWRRRNPKRDLSKHDVLGAGRTLLPGAETPGSAKTGWPKGVSREEGKNDVSCSPSEVPLLSQSTLYPSLHRILSGLFTPSNSFVITNISSA